MAKNSPLTEFEIFGCCLLGNIDTKLKSIFKNCPIQSRDDQKTFCLRLKCFSGEHKSALNLNCEKIDQENKTLQEVKSKSIEDEAKTTDAQKLNAKADTDAVKV